MRRAVRLLSDALLLYSREREVASYFVECLEKQKRSPSDKLGSSITWM